MVLIYIRLRARVELLQPPEGAKVGERVTFAGLPVGQGEGKGRGRVRGRGKNYCHG